MNSETVGLLQPFKEVKGLAITINDVRQIALSLPKTDEVEHWDKPSFRVNGKIYAVVQKDGVSVTVKTTREEREALTTFEPEIYSVPTNFQRLHYMIVNTERIRKDDFRSVLVRAWRLVASKHIVKTYDEQRSK
ncbi:MmcQ/YjbR family DNA-binding protein [Paenibacillus ginsengarvi]|uniref:MmcQ/YjbR family DNA-binding protein n=2 Tax=Paenibacillus ginsengarvi TaxID=400777 RepID=A0A3B0CEW5_9BACL|nr:MmcQ/YjbR family DNA-binding protein [Paenibacillus ginsengarvi]